MKQRKLVSMIGMLVLLIGITSMGTGCRDPQQESENNTYKASFKITYNLINCEYADFAYASYWEPAEQWVKEGEEIELAKDGSKSKAGDSTKRWKVEYVKHKDGKQIKGWSKKEDGSTKDYDFGQKINPTADMTLYPALSKYGMGDEIDGKTVIYVRRGVKDKIYCKDKYKKYSVTGTDWRYIAVDVSAAKNSEKRQWSSSAENVITSDAVGAGKENTAKILLKHNSDTDANNAAKYCKTISADSCLPSEAEAFLIYNAICGGKITGLPTYSQEERINLGTQFGYSKHAYFWTSTQSDKDNAYSVSLYKSDGIWGGEKSAKSKTETPAIRKAAYICPVIYYDDDGNVVR